MTVEQNPSEDSRAQTNYEVPDRIDNDKHFYNYEESDIDTLNLYFEEVKKYPLLTPQEEKQLFAQLDKGRYFVDGVRNEKNQKFTTKEAERAKDKIIHSNQRLVISVAIKKCGRGVAFLDLIQAGNLGLFNAVVLFDRETNNRFSTYAVPAITRAIRRELASQSRAVSIPYNEYFRINKLYAIFHNMQNGLGRNPTVDEISKEMGLPPKKVRELVRKSRYSVSLEQEIKQESEKSDTLMDFVSCSDDIEALSEQEIKKDYIEKILNRKLNNRYKWLVDYKYGFNGFEPHTQQQIADELGVSRQNISQLFERIHTKLKLPLRDFRNDPDKPIILEKKKKWSRKSKGRER